MTDLNQIIEAGLLKHVCAIGIVFLVIALSYTAIFIQQSTQKKCRMTSGRDIKRTEEVR